MRVLIVLVIVFFAACGGDICSQAADKLDSCGFGATQVTGSCDPVSACESQCIVDASCDDISAAFRGTPNAYSNCDDACN